MVEQRTENPRVAGSIPALGTICGLSSSGRAPPCQGGGSEFEPRRPLHFCGSLAQLGEHLPYKQRVTGSSPVGPIINKNADVAQLAEQLICNQQVIGSSPIIGFMEHNSIWMDSRVAKGDRL